MAILSSRLVLRFADKDAEEEFTAMCFRAIVPACIVMSTLRRITCAGLVLDAKGCYRDLVDADARRHCGIDQPRGMPHD